jgi:hypothetical protein
MYQRACLKPVLKEIQPKQPTENIGAKKNNEYY